jgi:hypothetical protein
MHGLRGARRAVGKGYVRTRDTDRTANVITFAELPAIIFVFHSQTWAPGELPASEEVLGGEGATNRDGLGALAPLAPHQPVKIQGDPKFLIACMAYDLTLPCIFQPCKSQIRCSFTVFVAS